MAERLVHIVDDVPELTAPSSEPGERVEVGDYVGGGEPARRELTMVVALDGFLDSGNSAAIAAKHLVAVGTRGEGGGRVVATFEVDAFHDYRARRPAISFVQDHYESYDAPRLVVRLLRDSGDTPFLLLAGPEPDNRWEAFAGAVREVVERFGVTRTLSLGSVPMAVPHTRPIAITHHANNPELLTGTSPWRGELRVPSSAMALLEVRLGEWGHDALGFVAHVPHYLSQLDYPKAAVDLLTQAELGGRLTIDISAVRAQTEQRDAEIADYLSSHEDVAQIVTSLEEQYDTFARSEQSGSSLLADNQPLPTGDELGQQFEQFLAGLDGPEGADDGEPEDPRA